MVRKITRGMRNNNPLNIRKSSSSWKGKITPSQDSEFEQFISLKHGFRAAMILIRNYVLKYHLTSVTQILERFAPASENPTFAYISYVSKCLADDGCSQIIEVPHRSFFVLIKAMAKFESNIVVSVDYLKSVYYDCC